MALLILVLGALAVGTVAGIAIAATERITVSWDWRDPPSRS